MPVNRILSVQVQLGVVVEPAVRLLALRVPAVHTPETAVVTAVTVRMAVALTKVLAVVRAVTLVTAVSV
jgi:hypothetical protein